MDDRQLIADLLSALEYHTEQTRPIEFSKVAIEAAREYLQKPAQQEPVALLRVFMDSVDMGQSLAPNREFKFASASAYPAAKMLPLGDHDLYTTPRPAQRKPLTGEQVTDGCRSLGVGAYQTLGSAFEAGVRFAEAAHGITKGGAA